MTTVKPDQSRDKARVYAGNINAEQEAAILAINGPSIVIAGPGSGKTQTLTAKALYIQAVAKGANPVHHPYAEGGRGDAWQDRKARRPESINVSTIHSLCYRILQDFPAQSLKILSNYDHGAIIRMAARAVGIRS